MDPIILASASPRRHELMKLLNIPFQVVVSSADESVPHNCPPVQVATEVAERKARAIACLERTKWILGADTIVVCGDQILGKPIDLDDARGMLRLLSGQTHQVITGMALFDPRNGEFHRVHESTRVSFKNLTNSELEGYLRTGEPMDKAGAYAVQGRAAVFVERLDGCYFNVVGLPVYRLARMLEECGFDFWESWNNTN